MPRFARPRLVVAAAAGALVAAGAAGGIAFSAPQSDDGLIHACFNQSDIDKDGSGQVLLVNAGAPCPAGWPQTLTWNAVGPRGLTGDPGTKGEQGAKGADGKGTGLSTAKQTEVLAQQKKDQAKAKQLGTRLDKIVDQLDGLDDDSQIDVIKLYATVNRLAQSTEQLATLQRRLSEHMRDVVAGAQ